MILNKLLGTIFHLLLLGVTDLEFFHSLHCRSTKGCQLPYNPPMYNVSRMRIIRGQKQMFL
jgi:hypothetical protein